MAEKDQAIAESKSPKKKPEKVKRVAFHASFYSSGVAKYKAGEHYPVTPETESRVVAGDAKVVDVEMDPDEHTSQLQAAQAALNHERRQTLAAEGEAIARGQLTA